MNKVVAFFWSAVCALVGGGCQRPVWHVAASDGEAWMLSVTANSERILAVGGQPEKDGKAGSGVLSFLYGTEGARLLRVKSPEEGMLWWVHAPTSRVAWTVGERGAILYLDEAIADPVTGVKVRTFVSPVKTTFYGVWAFADDDVWIVGGDEAKGGVILHGGLQAGFTQVPDVPRTGILYKVYGASKGSVFAVGAGAALLRLVNGVWILDPPPIPANERLLAVHGRGGEDVFAVGGAGQGRLLHFTGTSSSWRVLPTPSVGALSGVYAEKDGTVLLAGQRGQLVTYLPKEERQILPEPLTQDDLHATFALDKERFAVGGNLTQFGNQTARGVILHEGDPPRTVSKGD